jgi:hypothetical protein
MSRISCSRREIVTPLLDPSSSKGARTRSATALSRVEDGKIFEPIIFLR